MSEEKQPIQTLAHGESTASVGDVLESISDTISQLVLFQVEAHENESSLVRLDVAPLLSSLKLLIDLGRRKAERWTDEGEKKNKDKMLKACATSAEACSRIDESLAALKADPFDAKAKDDVLWSARTIIQSTVALLQLSDNYDIRKTIKAAKSSEAEQLKMINGDMAQLQESVRQLVYETVNLAKLVQDRIDYIDDEMLKKKLQACNEVVRTQAEPLIHAHVAVLQAPDDAAAKKKRDDIDSELRKAYKKLISLAKLTSQEMFSGIDLNLNPLDDDDKYKEIQALDLSLDDACRRIIDLGGNQCSAQQMEAMIRDAQNACAKEIEKAKQAIADETDPEKKKVLEVALENLEAKMHQLREVATAVSKRVTPAEAKQIADIAIALMDAGTQMQQAIEMPDHLDRAANMVQMALANLATALKIGSEPEVLAAAKAVNAALQDQVNLAKEKVKKDPKRKRALNQGLQAQQGVMRGLLNGTKGLLEGRNGPNARPLWDTFNANADDLAALSQQIADLSDPARAAQMFMTPEEIIQNAIRRINEDMEKLQKGGPDSAEALKAVAAGLNALMGLAKNRKGNRMNAIASAMAGTLGGMLKSGREYLKDPSSNYKGIDRDCSAVRDHELELLKALIPVPDRMVDLCGDLAEDSAKLLRALEDNDARQANISHDNVNRHLKDSIDAIENTSADGEKRAYLDKLKASQQHVLDELDPAVKKSLANPDDAKALERVEDLLEEARNNTMAIASAVAEDLEYAAIAGAARANSAMRSLKQSVNTADEEAADSARRNADVKVRRQAVLADLLALQTKDDNYKASLLEASRDLGDVQSSLSEATESALTGSDGDLKSLINDSRDANQAIVDGIQDPVGRMEALGVRINNHINALSYPIDERQRLGCVNIVDGLEQQVILGAVVGKRDGDKKEDLDHAIGKANAVLEKLKPAILDCMSDPKDRAAQNYVEDLMMEARLANTALVEAAQSKDIFDRILANVDATEREMAKMDECLRKGDRGTAMAIAADLKARQQKQSQLLKKASAKVGPRLGRKIEEQGLQIAKLGANLASATEGRACNPKDVGAATAYNRGVNKMKGANKEIRDLIARARSGEDDEEEKPAQDTWIGMGQGGLMNAAAALRKRTRELKIDGSARGQMFAEAQKIAELMQKLAQAAQDNDKAGIINISREIATCATNVLKIAKTIPANPDDKNQIVSFAQSAKGTSVQLKIMASVKASIQGRDRTAEEQLITCTQTLADQVGSAVQTAVGAELRVK